MSKQLYSSIGNCRNLAFFRNYHTTTKGTKKEDKIQKLH